MTGVVRRCARCGEPARGNEPSCSSCGGAIVASYNEQDSTDPLQLSLLSPQLRETPEPFTRSRSER